MYIDALAFLIIKNTCAIINNKPIICIFAPVFVKKANKNLIFMLLWSVPRATALPYDFKISRLCCSVWTSFCVVEKQLLINEK